MMNYLYARKEPSTDPFLRGTRVKKKDVVVYLDRAAKKRAYRIPWDMTAPRKSSKSIMYNCCKYGLVWI